MSYNKLNIQEVENGIKISDLITILKGVQKDRGDIEVCAQSSGCCSHPHEVQNIVLYEEGSLWKFVLEV